MFPDIKENLIAFTTDDDIWIYDISKGTASRVTSGNGVSVWPKISPDKRSIVFTRIWLNKGKSVSDLFLIDENGERRITYFNTLSIRVSQWISDKEIIAITDYKTPFSTVAYKINVETGEY